MDDNNTIKQIGYFCLSKRKLSLNLTYLYRIPFQQKEECKSCSTRFEDSHGHGSSISETPVETFAEILVHLKSVKLSVPSGVNTRRMAGQSIHTSSFSISQGALELHNNHSMHICNCQSASPEIQLNFYATNRDKSIKLNLATMYM